MGCPRVPTARAFVPASRAICVLRPLQSISTWRRSDAKSRLHARVTPTQTSSGSRLPSLVPRCARGQLLDFRLPGPPERNAIAYAYHSVVRRAHGARLAGRRPHSLVDRRICLVHRRPLASDCSRVSTPPGEEPQSQPHRRDRDDPPFCHSAQGTKAPSETKEVDIQYLGKQNSSHTKLTGFGHGTAPRAQVR